MKKIFTALFLLGFVNIFSQTSYTLLKDFPSKSDFVKHDLLFSVKAGYHTGNNKNSSNGFNGGVLYNIGAEMKIGENTYAGSSYEFFQHNDNTFETGYDIRTRKYTGHNISLFWLKRIGSDNITFNYGLGAGVYSLRTDFVTKTFFNLKLITGLDLKISKTFWISPEINFTPMVNFNNSTSLFSFKIGPTILLRQ
jgi:hypothetical protein